MVCSFPPRGSLSQDTAAHTKKRGVHLRLTFSIVVCEGIGNAQSSVRREARRAGQLFTWPSPHPATWRWGKVRAGWSRRAECVRPQGQQAQFQGATWPGERSSQARVLSNDGSSVFSLTDLQVRSASAPPQLGHQLEDSKTQGDLVLRLGSSGGFVTLVSC